MNRRVPVVSRDEIRERKLLEMSQTVRHTKDVLGMKLFIDPDVYAPATDTFLMMNNIQVVAGGKALDIGTGTGAIAFKMVKDGASDVLGIDLNPRAIINAEANKQRLHIESVRFQQGSVFEGISETFDVITFNPPYSNEAARNDIDICFYDKGHAFVREFFDGLRQHLKSDGRAYIAWSNLGDMSVLPALAKKNNFEIVQIAEDIGGRGYKFYVYEIAGQA